MTWRPSGIASKTLENSRNGRPWTNLTGVRSTIDSSSFQQTTRRGGTGNQEMAMKVRIQMVFDAEDGTTDVVEEIALLERGTGV